MRLESDLRRSFSCDPFYGGEKVSVGKARVYVDQRRTHRVVVAVEAVNKKRRKTNAVGNNFKQKTKSCDLSQAKFTILSY